MVKAKKHLGQHFLNNHSAAQEIVNESLGFASKNILEIGPGTGVLTDLFLEKENIFFKAIEVDRESIAFLKQKYFDRNFIIEEDFLKFNVNSLKKESLILCGNFPYNISSQIMFRFLENRHIYLGMVGMFQKEVADRIIAPPGSKVYGILSVLTQAYYDGQLLLDLLPNNFSPPPKVNSAVIKLVKKPLDPSTNFEFHKLKLTVKTAFNQRRKMLRNSLSAIVKPENELFKKYAMLRPEQLSVQDFITLSNII